MPNRIITDIGIVNKGAFMKFYAKNFFRVHPEWPEVIYYMYLSHLAKRPTRTYLVDKAEDGSWRSFRCDNGNTFTVRKEDEKTAMEWIKEESK